MTARRATVKKDPAVAGEDAERPTGELRRHGLEVAVDRDRLQDFQVGARVQHRPTQCKACRINTGDHVPGFYGYGRETVTIDGCPVTMP